MRLAEFVLEPPKILLYGPPGGGKTALASTLGPGCIYIDVDGGIETAVTLKDKHSNDRKEIDYIPIKEVNVFTPAKWRKVKEKVIELVNMSPEKLKGKSVVLDSITTAGEAAMQFILGNSSRLGTDGTIKTKSGGPEIQDWGLAMAELERVLMYLRSLPCTVVVIGHQEMKPITENRDGEKVNYMVELHVIGSKLAPKVPSYFTEVWYLKPKSEAGGKLSYHIKTKHTSEILARSRLNLPDPVDANLGMKEILKLAGYKDLLNVNTNSSPNEVAKIS